MSSIEILDAFCNQKRYYVLSLFALDWHHIIKFGRAMKRENTLYIVVVQALLLST